MIHYDTAVIGSGIAGLTAAIYSQSHGQRTVLISQGQSAMHFASGSIDVLSRLPDGAPVSHPFKSMATLFQLRPTHPYHRVGVDTIRASLTWFSEMLAGCGVPLTHQADEANHFRITALGTLKSTWLSQPYVYQHRHHVPFKRIVVISVKGYRDFSPQMIRDNLSLHPDFANTPIVSQLITLPVRPNGHHNWRALDLAHQLRIEANWQHWCDQLNRIANADDLVVLPAILGNGDGLFKLSELHKITGLTFNEVAAMPPSLLGIRIEESLLREFRRLGGTLLRGDSVTGGEFYYDKLVNLSTAHLGNTKLHAERFIMATGSYFSQGLKAEYHEIREPVFALEMDASYRQGNWYQPRFAGNQAHPFVAFGVKTDAHLHPYRQGKVVSNLYCCGAMLANYDPVFEGCGGGVAIATAFYAAKQTLQAQQAIYTDEATL